MDLTYTIWWLIGNGIMWVLDHVMLSILIFIALVVGISYVGVVSSSTKGTK